MQNFSEIRNRWFIEHVKKLEFAGTMQAEIANRLNVMPQYLNAIMGGRRNASEKFVNKFCIEFQLNQNDLFDKMNAKPDGDGQKSQIGSIISAKNGAERLPNGIPLIGLDVAAGFGTTEFSINELDIQALYVVPDFTNIDFMIRVKGNSMYPKYSSGDIIACRKLHDSKFIQWNKCYVIATSEQGLLVKRIRQSDKPEFLLAVSDNKEYQPFDIPKDEITGVALVIGVIRLE